MSNNSIQADQAPDPRDDQSSSLEAATLRNTGDSLALNESVDSGRSNPSDGYRWEEVTLTTAPEMHGRTLQLSETVTVVEESLAASLGMTQRVFIERHEPSDQDS